MREREREGVCVRVCESSLVSEEACRCVLFPFSQPEFFTFMNIFASDAN